jgi:hypothetical protein
MISISHHDFFLIWLLIQMGVIILIFFPLKKTSGFGLKKQKLSSKTDTLGYVNEPEKQQDHSPMMQDIP